jgi:hypothetical protein
VNIVSQYTILDNLLIWKLILMIGKIVHKSNNLPDHKFYEQPSDYTANVTTSL